MEATAGHVLGDDSVLNLAAFERITLTLDLREPRKSTMFGCLRLLRLPDSLRAFSTLSDPLVGAAPRRPLDAEDLAPLPIQDLHRRPGPAMACQTSPVPPEPIVAIRSTSSSGMTHSLRPEDPGDPTFFQTHSSLG